jgi:hypothetical protein
MVDAMEYRLPSVKTQVPLDPDLEDSLMCVVTHGYLISLIMVRRNAPGSLLGYQVVFGRDH